MGIFSKKQVKGEQPEERALNFGLGFSNLSSYAGESQAMRLSAVYAAVNLISNSIAMLPINIYRRENGKKVQVNHSLYGLLNLRPDIHYNKFQFFKYVLESVMLRGEAYCLIQRDEQLNVVGLEYVDNQLVTPIPAGNAIKYIVAGVPNAVDDINILHFYMHCDETYRGISVLKYAYETLMGAADAEKTANNFFKSGGNLSGIIKASSTLNNEQKKQIREAWAAAFDTQNNKVNVAVLPNGLDYQQISVDPEDAQLLESRQWSIFEIARFFNIPPSKLGVRENVSYNSLEQDQLMYIQQTLMPYTHMMQNEMDLKLVKPSQVGKTVMEFDYMELMKGDKKSEADYYKSLITNGLLSPNEARTQLGLEPIEGGDNYFMQLSYTTTNNIINGAFMHNNNQEQTQNQKVDNKV